MRRGAKERGTAMTIAIITGASAGLGEAFAKRLKDYFPQVERGVAHRPPPGAAGGPGGEPAGPPL